MIILDHGNICVYAIFMIIIMHSFPDIELFCYNDVGPHLHTHNMHIIQIALISSYSYILWFLKTC